MKEASLNRLALSATAHCLTGCAIGEVLGVAIGTALGWGNLATIVLAVGLAFLFGYSLTMVPLLRAGLAVATAVPLALASDTLSIAVMEIVDNGVLLSSRARWRRGSTTRSSGPRSPSRSRWRSSRPSPSTAG